MATCAPLTAVRSDATPAPAAGRRGSALVAWAVLVLVLALGLPLFLCMPLWNDVIHYDLCARTLLRGGVPYRDVFDNNLPGIVWMQAAVRAVLGWRPEALRLADFGFMALVVLLLLRWVPARARWAPARAGTAAALAGFYLFIPEYGHCQRDGWMLLPATVALCLRDRQLRAAGTAPGTAVFGRAVLEGLCWGAAFWVKPFVAVPALACWAVGALSRRRGRGRIVLDAGGLLAGGLLAGGLGVAYLTASGAWQSFWDILLGWNGEYAARTYGGYPRHQVLLSSFACNLPWSLVHVPAIAIALAAVARAVRARGTAGPTSVSRALLGAFYLGWLIQATLIQRPHEYVMMTTVFPAVVIVAAAPRAGGGLSLREAFLVNVALLAAFLTPGLQLERLGLWAQCWREGSTPELRDRLALMPRTFPGAADWQDLARVADFLRAESVADGELTCLSGSTHPLYLELNLKSSTRFHQPLYLVVCLFPSRAEQLRAELAASRSRYVVSDLTEWVGLTYAQALEEVPGRPLALPPSFPPGCLGAYPWCEPLVFRAGRYVVHRAQGPVTKFW